MTWQPIETAPRDGTRVLVFCHRYDVDYFGACRFRTYKDGSAGWVGGSAWTDPEGCWSAFLQPTHWMPLPTPPYEPTAPSRAGVDPERCTHAETTCRTCGQTWTKSPRQAR